MSKLEDKLTASIKPRPRKGLAETTAASAASAPALPKGTHAHLSHPTTVMPDLNDANRPLHPDRIWPD